MSLIFANIIGWIVAHWRIVALIAGIILILVLVFSVYSCLKPVPKLDEAEIQKGEAAVKERNDKELREILTNSDVREAQIVANVSNARAETVNAIQEAREKYANMNTDDLAAELEKRK